MVAYKTKNKNFTPGRGVEMSGPGADLRWLGSRFLSEYRDRMQFKHISRDGNDDRQVGSETGHSDYPLPRVLKIGSSSEERMFLYM